MSLCVCVCDSFGCVTQTFVQTWESIRGYLLCTSIGNCFPGAMSLPKSIRARPFCLYYLLSRIVLPITVVDTFSDPPLAWFRLSRIRFADLFSRRPMSRVVRVCFIRRLLLEFKCFVAVVVVWELAKKDWRQSGIQADRQTRLSLRWWTILLGSVRKLAYVG